MKMYPSIESAASETFTDLSKVYGKSSGIRICTKLGFKFRGTEKEYLRATLMQLHRMLLCITWTDCFCLKLLMVAKPMTRWYWCEVTWLPNKAADISWTFKNTFPIYWSGKIAPGLHNLPTYNYGDVIVPVHPASQQFRHEHSPKPKGLQDCHHP